MNNTLTLKHEFEDLLYREADLCDDWQLQEWLAMWAEGELLYEVGPLDTPHGEKTTHRDALYLVSDNRFRLEQRVIRMLKSGAHAEYPVRSKLRHLYANIRDIVEKGDEVSFRVNMIVTRTRRDCEGVSVIPGVVLFTFVRQNGAFRIRSKRIFLDLHVLANPGTMSIII